MNTYSLLGTIERDIQIRAIKNKETKHTNHNHRGKGPNSSVSPDPSGSRTQVPSRPTPQSLGRRHRLARPLGLGRKTRLDRPLQGSGAGRLSTRSARLPSYGAHTRDAMGAVTPIPQQGEVATVSTIQGTAALPLSLCDLTSFTVAYRLTVEREWERLTSATVRCLLPLSTGRPAVPPTRPPRFLQGSVTLYRGSHTVSHPTRTRWTCSSRVGTVASPFNRRNLLM